MSPLAPDLKIGVTFAIFQISGKLPAVSDEFYISVRGRARNSDASLACLTGILFCPLALPFFSQVSASDYNCFEISNHTYCHCHLLSLILARGSSVDLVLILFLPSFLTSFLTKNPTCTLD